MIGESLIDWQLPHLMDLGGSASNDVVISYIWVNYNDLTTTSPEMMVSNGNHPQMALIQISELV